jgi:hypothetical protein
MTARRSDEGARDAAETAHGDHVEPSGSPFIAHVRRVAAAVPPSARRVAWLHDALEWTDLGEEGLSAAGLRRHEIAAVRLLTRDTGIGDDRRFLDHVRAIATARGRAGRIARAVKRADMQDRAAHPRDPGAGWRPPYEAAGRVLAGASRTWPRRTRRLHRPHPIQEES